MTTGRKAGSHCDARQRAQPSAPAREGAGVRDEQGASAEKGRRARVRVAAPESSTEVQTSARPFAASTVMLRLRRRE
eukprot:5338496-Pleurochrysis_carterae.AAC.1